MFNVDNDNFDVTHFIDMQQVRDDDAPSGWSIQSLESVWIVCEEWLVDVEYYDIWHCTKVR